MSLRITQSFPCYASICNAHLGKRRLGELQLPLLHGVAEAAFLKEEEVGSGREAVCLEQEDEEGADLEGAPQVLGVGLEPPGPGCGAEPGGQPAAGGC